MLTPEPQNMNNKANASNFVVVGEGVAALSNAAVATLPGAARALALEEVRNQARRQVEEAIECLPLEQKDAYLQAKKHSPELFETESDPLWFLRRCDYNAWEAARRLCLYWKERLDIFGLGRAFLPLILTGDGALTNEDIYTIRAGYPAILPNTRNNDQVVLLDRRQHVPSSTSENKLRCIFYATNQLAQEERAQVEGVLCLILFVTPRLAKIDEDFTRSGVRLFNDVIPVKFKYHVLNIPPTVNARQKYNIQDLFLFAISMVKPEDMEVHFERESGDLLQTLRDDLGLVISGIPNFFGGSWTLDQCCDWCEARAEEEHEKHDKWELLIKRRRFTHPEQAISCVGPNQKFGVVSNTLPSMLPTNPEEEAQQKQEMEAERKEKKRQQSVLWSRRGRDRRRRETEELKKEHGNLIADNKKLRVENANLETLIQQAQVIAMAQEVHGSS